MAERESQGGEVMGQDIPKVLVFGAGVVPSWVNTHIEVLRAYEDHLKNFDVVVAKNIGELDELFKAELEETLKALNPLKVERKGTHYKASKFDRLNQMNAARK